MIRLALPASFGAVGRRLPPDVEVVWYTDGADCPAAMPGVEVLWLDMWRTEEVEAALRAGDRLHWVTCPDAGMDSMPFALFRERGIHLTNGAGLHAVPMAEYVVMVMLAAAKGFATLVHAQSRAEWFEGQAGGGELLDTRALIIGYGGIGRMIGQRLQSFGVRVTGVRRRPDPEEADVLGPADWRTRLAEFDWVILSTPLTGQTHHLIGAAEFAAMKSTAWIMNVARGRVIDQGALELALHKGDIGGAYLDLTDPEPLPAASVLWHLPNVIITPHRSPDSRRFEERAIALFLDNLARYRTGQPLRNLVDLDAGY